MAYSGTLYNLLPGDPQDDQWKTPLALAVGLHLLVLALSLLPPSLFYHRPVIPEAITINLFNAEEQPRKTAEPRKTTPPPRQPEKAVPPPAQKPVTSISQEPPPPAASAPEKVISLAPRKIKKKAPPPPEEPKRKTAEDKLLKALERTEARVNKKREDEKVVHGLARLRESLHIEQPAETTSGPPAPSTSASTPGPPAPAASTSESSAGPDQASAPSTGSAELMDMAEKRYYIAVSRRIHEHWVLPEMQNWNESLEALMVVIVRSDGAIIQSFFEKKSGNPYFNQFVEKTIKEAAPLPQFPADLKKTKLEIGLRFRPSGLY